MNDTEEYLPVGKISGAFGVKGWVKVYSFTEPRENILSYSPLYISRRGEWLKVNLTGGQRQGRTIVMGLENVTDRDQAAALTGTEIAIRRDQLEPADENEFYWADLIGLQVINTENESLGEVDHLLETGANDVLVVVSDNEPGCLVPFVMEEVVHSVDLDNQVIRVDWQKDY